MPSANSFYRAATRCFSTELADCRHSLLVLANLSAKTGADLRRACKRLALAPGARALPRPMPQLRDHRWPKRKADLQIDPHSRLSILAMQGHFSIFFAVAKREGARGWRSPIRQRSKEHRGHLSVFEWWCTAAFSSRSYSDSGATHR